jgi:hypothetical protein
MGIVERFGILKPRSFSTKLLYPSTALEGLFPEQHKVRFPGKYVPEAAHPHHVRLVLQYAGALTQAFWVCWTRILR